MVAAATMVTLTTSCDGVVQSKEIDYQVLSKPNDFKVWYDEVLKKAGDNAKVMDEVDFSIRRPSEDGRKDKDYIMINVVYQDPADKRRVEEVDYFGNITGWQSPQKKEIEILVGNAEDYRLEDDLFDFTQVSFDILNKVIADALAKYKDEAKYENQYVKHLYINEKEIEVVIYGKIKANGVEKSEYYRTDLKGNAE